MESPFWILLLFLNRMKMFPLVGLQVIRTCGDTCFQHLGGENTDLSIQSDSPHPNHFELVNIFPNPFNSTINLEYKVHNPGSEIKISLYSLLGREVYSLHHWVNISGEDRIQIKFRDGMSTGLYLLQLNYNDQIQSEKILYLK